MRAFVAIELDEACRRALLAATERLKAAAPGVRWVRPTAMHLTLKFIGELPEADLPAAIECLGAACAGTGEFEMEVSGLSGFPARGTPRVVYAATHEPTGRLASLQRSVEEALAGELGLAQERRPFRAHITLGRVRGRGCPPVGELSALIGDQVFGSVQIGSAVLMKSDLQPTGAIYTPVHRFPLAD